MCLAQGHNTATRVGKIILARFCMCILESRRQGDSKCQYSLGFHEKKDKSFNLILLIRTLSASV